MAWSEKTMERLHIFIHDVVSYTGGPHRDDKFYDFIASVWNEEKRVWDESRSRDIINGKIRDLDGDPDHSYTAEQRDKYMTLGTDILEFLVRHISEIES